MNRCLRRPVLLWDNLVGFQHIKCHGILLTHGDLYIAQNGACAQIVDLLAAQLAVGAAPGAQSVSNDGYAVTFAANTSLSAAVRFEAWHVLEAALGSDPHGLLYRGIM